MEASLTCSFGIDDGVIEDLSKMPCGHPVSRHNWEQYKAANHGRELRCPLCKRLVEEIGRPLAVSDIKGDLVAVRESCERLKAALSWDGPRLDEESSPGRDEESFLSRDEELMRHGQSPVQDPRLEHEPSRAERLASEFQLITSPAGDNNHERAGDISLIDFTEDPEEIRRRDSNSSQTTTKTIPRCSSVVLPRSPNNEVPEESSSVPTWLRTEVIGPVRLTEKGRKPEDVTISTGGLTVALIEKSSFEVLAITQNSTFKSRKDFPVVCYGRSPRSPTGSPDSTYHRAALSEDILCITCIEGHIDVYNAHTGQQLHRIQPPQECRNLLLSPNGEVLAVAMISEGVLCYPIGHDRKFDTLPMDIIRSHGTAIINVNCMAFSPDSANISVCSVDNIIRTFSLNIESCSANEISRYLWNLPSKARHGEYGITNVSLFVSLKGSTNCKHQRLGLRSRCGLNERRISPLPQ